MKYFSFQVIVDAGGKAPDKIKLFPAKSMYLSCHWSIQNNITCMFLYFLFNLFITFFYAYFYGTVVPVLGDPRRERSSALYGHVINAPANTFQR